MSKIRVALIEDHDLTRIGIRMLLQQLSEIEFIGEAVNGTEGLNLIKVTKPDICIIDLGLPDIDGIELTRHIKEAQTETEETLTKILILTLEDTEDAVIAAFAAGADSYCMKDISFELLLEALRTTYEGNNWIDPAIARIVLSQAKQSQSETDISRPRNKVNMNPPKGEYTKIIKTYPLTDRELEVLQLIVDGCSNAQIAEKLFISIGTVKTHVRNILNKLCADDRTQAAVRALRSGLVY